MEEATVIKFTMDYLTKQGWEILPSKGGYHFEEYEIVPDIICKNEKGEKIFFEAKGSDFEELKRGIGQVLTYIFYADYVCLTVPNDMEKITKKLLTSFKIKEKGKIGLLVVNEDGSVKVSIEPKKLYLKSKITPEVQYKLVYFADITLDELGKMIDFAYRHRGEYETATEFNKLMIEKYTEITSRKFEKESAKKKMLNNFKISLTHLNLWDKNYQLNSRGKQLRELFEKRKEEFKKRVAYMLLIEGHWIGLLGVIHELSSQNFSSKREYKEKLTEMLIERGFLRKTEKLRTLAMKMDDRFLRFLKELNFVSENENKFIVKWGNVADIILEFSY